MKWTDQIALNNGWRFSLGDFSGAEAADFDDAAFVDVTLPHDWQIAAERDPDMAWGWSQGYYPRYQVCWYRLRLDRRPEWAGKTIRLLIDGCQRFYDVYLNGERVGGHRFGYVPCLIDLTGMLKEHNVLAIRVNNADTKGDRWYSGAGLNRGVRLLVDDPVHIAPWSLFATYELDVEDHARVKAQVHLQNSLSAPVEATLTLALKGPDGAFVCQEKQTVMVDPGVTAVIVGFALDHVQRWDVDAPHLYCLTAALDSAATHDEVYHPEVVVKRLLLCQGSFQTIRPYFSPTKYPPTT